ncbi:MAG: bifunctional chorismate mutase/prephenate dehydratase, partial [Ruminococcaceae bacterium]|nr:bifunctional chorismate mutase/prephenate dehydratase [Oscillospiraceae bacterium]
MSLEEIRNEIDSIDTELATLFKKRMECAKKVAEIKKKENKIVLNQSREREILNRVAGITGEELQSQTKVLYSTIFDLSRSYQTQHMADKSELETNIKKAIENTPNTFPKKAVVACQGVEGAYSQIVCDKLFSLPSIMYFNNFEGVFSAVEKGLCDYGILPIENSSYGSVNKVYDLMKKHKFYIAKSIKYRVNHSLLVKPNCDVSQIKEIFSHEQAIGQSSEFLKQFPLAKITICENTALAAKTVAESDRTDVAALSSKDCAALYGLKVTKENVQDNDNNYTRFICISKELEIYPGADKISLMLTASHKPGALYELIAKFSALGLNLTKLESRPIPGTDFEFMFYFDMNASVY